jgi:hypothetical protein
MLYHIHNEFIAEEVGTTKIDTTNAINQQKWVEHLKNIPQKQISKMICNTDRREEGNRCFRKNGGSLLLSP